MRVYYFRCYLSSNLVFVVSHVWPIPSKFEEGRTKKLWLLSWTKRNAERQDRQTDRQTETNRQTYSQVILYLATAIHCNGQTAGLHVRIFAHFHVVSHSMLLTYDSKHSLMNIVHCLFSSKLHSIIIRPRRSRSAAAYSHQTFPCTICRSVGRSVCLSSALWKNDRSHPAAVWHHRSDGSTDEAGIGVWQSVHGKGYFWRQIWTAPL